LLSQLNLLTNKESMSTLKEPVERLMGKISKMSQSYLQNRLSHLDINRSFYPLMLIESGNGITQQELAQKLSCDKVQVVRIINYLSVHGYVLRVQNQSDKRKYELTISEKAKVFLPDIKNAINEMSDISLKYLSENQKTELYNMLVIMEKNLLSQKSKL